LPVIQEVMNSSVGIATGYEIRADRPRFRSRQGLDFSLLHGVRTGSGAHPASYPMGTGDNFSGVKETERVSDNSHLRLMPG
jgi:hypothetical protein